MLVGVRTVGGVLLLVPVLLPALSGCARSPQDQAHDRLQERLDSVHEGYLERRAHDPTSTGREALEQLDPYGYALRSSADGDVVTLVEPIGVSVIEQHWFDSHEITLGACVRVVIVAGEGGDDRGTVLTEPVQCPAGTEVTADNGHSVDELTTDLEGRSDDVGEPPPDRPVCLSGGAPCTEGGG